MATRNISRHVKWVESNLPELAHLGQREVDRTISRAERGITTLRAVLYAVSILVSQFVVVPVVADSLFQLPEYSRWNSLIVVACILPLLFVSNEISDRVWRKRIQSSIRTQSKD